ncbi:hypothetical protein AAVH_16077 [Aphelenchoides avenae]|nr:hypothetical protein AAVH_16077 [Aphelenchus avenae]
MHSLLVVLVIVGCASSASIELRTEDVKDAAAWCNKLSKGFTIDYVDFVGYGAWTTEDMPGSLNRSLACIAKFDRIILDGFMSRIGATKSWTTGTYTVDCADADSLPKLEVFTSFDELYFAPSDYVDLKNPTVGQCKVLLLPGSRFTFGNLMWQKYCGAGNDGLTTANP